MSMLGRGPGEKILDPATMPLLKLQFDRAAQVADKEIIEQFGSVLSW